MSDARSKRGLALSRSFIETNFLPSSVTQFTLTRSRISDLIVRLADASREREGVACLSFVSVEHLKSRKRAPPRLQQDAVLQQWARQRVLPTAIAGRLGVPMRNVVMSGSSLIPQKARAIFGIGLVRSIHQLS